MQLVNTEVPELNYLNDTWVDFPLYQVLRITRPRLHRTPDLRNPDAP
jgi:hypothetical protein